MLFAARFREPIARGDVTQTFRRWKRCQVRAGGRYRTSAGYLEVDRVDRNDPGAIADADAHAAGYADDRSEISKRLDGLDRASSSGPWTRAALGTIRDRPGVRAADLAASFGRDTPPFKLDVRKLKNLGLALSLGVGYRLSPRGHAYLDGAAGEPNAS